MKCEASSACASRNEIDQTAIAGLMIDPQQLAGTRGHTFLATVGEKLHRYWKISKHFSRCASGAPANSD
jgi:hypothetical protein